MASNQTPNFGLNQWTETDRVLRTDFNADNEKIDAALLALDGRIQKEKNQLELGMQNLSASIGALAGRITMGSYVGNGKTGNSNRNRLIFPARPALVIVTGQLTAVFCGGIEEGMSSPGTGDAFASNPFCWEGNTLTWYNYSNSYFQLNENGLTYQYLALYLGG